jgi:ferrous-iron efflux pump FieF
MVLTKWAALPLADPVIAIAIGLYILKSAVDIAIGCYHELLDRELPDAERERIKRIVLDNPAVKNMHDLRTRSAGPDTFVQFHIELDPDLPLARAHAISDAVQKKLRAAMPSAEIIIHADPLGLIEPRDNFPRAS